MAQQSGGFAKLRHDLRTCVHQILGYSELLTEEAEEHRPEFIPDLERIHLAAERLLSLLDGIFADSPATPAQSSEPSADRSPAASPDGGTAEEQAPPASLLVVDDNEMNRDMLSRRLARIGHRVSVAVDGREALRKIEEEPFDLVLLDIMMPDLSGLEVLERVRRSRNRAELPVIMATAKGESDDIVRAFELGANDYVTKPLDFPVVLARTRTHLAFKRAVDENRRLLMELELRNRFIRQTFGRYLSDDVVSSLLEDRGGLQLGGEKRRITIMMTDLRGFSSISERLEPPQVVRLLNNYLEIMTAVIFEHQGTIDEFIGDAILVFFGAPAKREDHAKAAVRCALAMQEAMARVNARNQQEELPEVEMGIGIHTGDVVVGNIGSEKRTKYAAVGSSVNLASRIESYTVGTQILISEETALAAGEQLVTGERLEVQPKGHRGTLILHEVVGFDGREAQSPAEATALVELASPLAVKYTVVRGKDTGGAILAGEFVKLSLQEAEIRPAAELDPTTNLKVSMPVGSGGSGELYAKVLSRPASSAGCQTIRFTSLSPEAKDAIERLL